VSATAEPAGRPRVYSLRRGAEKPSPDAVRVDRKSPYGNPFVIGRDGDRTTVIAKHEAWWFDDAQAALREQTLRELRGRDLICWCAPEACHADLLLRFCNA
jgi:hypothetical protein